MPITLKRLNTLKQFVVFLPTNCLSVFDHFVGLVLKGLILQNRAKFENVSPSSFVPIKHTILFLHTEDFCDSEDDDFMP